MAFVAWDAQRFQSLSRRKLTALRKYGLPSAEEIQRISETITPRENLLALQQLQQFAPQLSALGTQIQGQEQQAGIRNDLSAIQGPGQELVGDALQLDMLVNPEFYGFRQQASEGMSRLLASQDPSKLSGSELAETERGLHRMNTSRGNINVTDSTTTAANAGAFGSALAGKQARFGQALSLIPSLSSVSRSPIDAFGIATGRGQQQNTLGAQNVTTGNQALGQNYQQQTGQTQGQYIQAKSGMKTGSDAFEGGVGACLSCYIFKEFFGQFDVPKYMRWCRDYEHARNPKIGRGYKRMSHWLVPLMQRVKAVRQVIYYTCILPLDKYCQYRTGYTTSYRWLKPVEWFWRNLWSSYAN